MSCPWTVLTARLDLAQKKTWERERERQRGEKNLVIVVSETRARKVGNLIGQTRSSSGSIGSSCTSGSAVADVCRFSRVLVIFWVLADLRNNKTGSPWEATNWLFVCWGTAAAAAAVAAFWPKNGKNFYEKEFHSYLHFWLQVSLAKKYLQAASTRTTTDNEPQN